MSDDGIIRPDFTKPEVDSVGLRVRPRRKKSCQHVNQIIDVKTRTISCAICCDNLDPIECMIGWGVTWERYERSVALLAQQSSDLAEKILEQKRQLRNLRAQCRRAARL